MNQNNPGQQPGGQTPGQGGKTPSTPQTPGTPKTPEKGQGQDRR